MRAFVDSSVWYAAADRDEGRNPRAKELLAGIGPVVITDHVLVETWLLINNRLGAHVANRFWGRIRAGIAEVERVTPEDLEAAWSIGRAFLDQDFSIVDRTSFAVMERLGITRVASFDHHFAVYRFGRDRRGAFEVLR